MEIHTGVKVTMDRVREINPDVVVVASGSTPLRKVFATSRLAEVDIPGADQEHILTLNDVFNEKIPIGERVVIIDDDGTQRTWGVAEWLAEKGKSVEVITERASAESAKLPLIWVDKYCLERLSEKGVKITTSTEVTKIEANSVSVLNRIRNEAYTVEGVDNVIVIGVNSPNDSLYFEIKNSGIVAHRIGDCVAPRSLEYAIWEGEEAGRQI